MYFPGNGNYLYTANNIFNVSSGTLQWTFETWVYPTNVNNSFFAIGSGGSYGNGLYCGWNGNNFSLGQGNGGSNPVSIASTSGTYYPYAWYHYAASKDSSGNIRLFINGVQVATQNYTSTVAAGTTVVINGVYDNSGLGNSGGQWYLSGLRLIIGQTLYTSAFTPPTAPPTPTANATLLLLGTNTGVQDATGKNDWITYGNATIQSSVVKYGSNALSFTNPTNGSYVYPASNILFSFGTGDFTIEVWLYPTSFSTTNGPSIIDFRPNATNASNYFAIGISTSGIIVYVVPNNASYITAGTALSLNTWTHFALCRSSGVTKMFLNGTQTGSSYTDTNNYGVGANRPIIGANGFEAPASGVDSFIGYMDDFRITKVARYTANFTPPTITSLTQ